MMRDHVRICLQNITGHVGTFDQAMEAFWMDVERQYKACNVMMIPQNHIPLWLAQAAAKGIPVAAVPKAAPPIAVEPAARSKREPVGV